MHPKFEAVDSFLPHWILADPVHASHADQVIPAINNVVLQMNDALAVQAKV